MSGTKTRPWKILALGREESASIENHVHELGYPNVKVIGLQNNKASDDRLIEFLKQGDWDAVSFGGGVNGFDDAAYPKEAATLYWFNRLVNIVHEQAPKTKIIFVTSPRDLADSFERVLGSQ